MRRFLSLISLTVFAALLASGVHAEEVVGMAKPWQMNFQPPATPVMERLQELHHYLLILITAIVVFVLGLLAYVSVRFSRKNNPVPSKTTHNTLVEVIWTVVPIMILVAIAIPSLRLHYFMDRTAEAEMTLKVTGFQWYWGYEYPEYDGLSFEAYIKKDDELKKGEPRLLATDKPVVVPVDTNVRVLTTSADVIHSFAMPAFGVKIDAVPGRLNETWFRATRPGIYYGQCSELCGVNHGYMPIEIHVVSKALFKQWIENAKNGNYDLAGIAKPHKDIAQEPADTEATPAVASVKKK